MSTKPAKQAAPQTVSATDTRTAQHALRAIHEALIRLSAATELMAEKTAGFDIEPAGVCPMLRDTGREAYGVGADGIEVLRQILGVEISMQEGEVDPFSAAYADMRDGTKHVLRGSQA